MRFHPLYLSFACLLAIGCAAPNEGDAAVEGAGSAQTATVNGRGCYAFVNGRGPSKIGQVALGATASKLCIRGVSSFGGTPRVQAEFSDAEGALGQFSIEEHLSRSPENENYYVILSGNANGENVEVTKLGSGEITFKGAVDPVLDIEKGTIDVGGDKFLYMKLQAASTDH